jgi:hypothetical protein
MKVCAEVVSGVKLRVPVDVYVAPDAIETVVPMVRVKVFTWRSPAVTVVVPV